MTEFYSPTTACEHLTANTFHRRTDVCHVDLIVMNVFSTRVTRADASSRWAAGKHVFAAVVMDFNERINRGS